MVASREPQNWQRVKSVELQAPQFGQLRVSAFIVCILAVGPQRDSGFSDRGRPARNAAIAAKVFALRAHLRAGRPRSEKPL